MLALTILLSGLTQAHAEQPNFVIIFADDQGHNDLSCFGSETIIEVPVDQRTITRRYTTSSTPPATDLDLSSPLPSQMVSASPALSFVQLAGTIDLLPTIACDYVFNAFALPASVLRNFGFGVMPTRPRSNRSASKQVATVGFDE